VVAFRLFWMSLRELYSEHFDRNFMCCSLIVFFLTSVFFFPYCKILSVFCLVVCSSQLKEFQIEF
jgi:hypothetical protein